MMQLGQNKAIGSTILALAALLTIMAASLLAAKPAHAATTFTVNSTSDRGDLTLGNGSCYTGVDLVVQGKECTLRAAIQEANATTGADTINFDIPGTGVNTISPASELPAITGPVSINGYSQPGAHPNTNAVGNDAVLKVELSGASAPNADGLEIGAANSTVKGLVVNRWSQGIRIDGPQASGINIVGNFIGTDASGTQALGNNVGVRVYHGSDNTIGGTTAGERNVISGNGHSGVGMGDGGGPIVGNRVVGNYIGTDASGTKDLGNFYYGVSIEGAPNTTVGGTTAGARNVISGNDEIGVAIYATDSKTMGNYIGTDASGTKDLGNFVAGVRINGPDNIVGGATAGARNVISGNADGVIISGAAARGNRVAGNFVGTDRTGSAPLSNSDGVRIIDAPGNTVGGTTAAERNVISANKSEGVVVFGNGARGNKVTGNYVGTDASGKGGLGNVDYGVTVVGAPNNVVGGATTGARNVISANGTGVILAEGATGNKVQGNFVGTDKTGADSPGNSYIGVTVYKASKNIIGGTQAGAGNLISAHRYDGVYISGDDTTGNRVLSNSIYDNGGLGIDLVGNAGPTPNDPGDADTGPNNLQNKPVLTAASKTATGDTVVRGELNSTPNKTFLVQFFSNPPGTDEGKKLIGQRSITSDANGNASFTFATANAVAAGQNVTATATETSTGDTSEFSAPRKVVAR